MAERGKVLYTAKAHTTGGRDGVSRSSDGRLDVRRYFLQPRLDVSPPGVEREVARALVDEAHPTCPYSEATRGNIDVVINLV